MKYTNGFLSALFVDRWKAETGDEHLAYTKRDVRVSIVYLDILGIRLQTGIIYEPIY
jgi:hypothetical protein